MDGCRTSKCNLYQSSIILNHLEGLKLTLASLKISYLEQLNCKILPCLHGCRYLSDSRRR
ncbi:hypothetical protein CWC21_09615 [Pseudoalteromonas phenolica]|nr:hypothetical protein CWC21_09615 [Pseudoalteromonas phenolica]